MDTDTEASLLMQQAAREIEAQKWRHYASAALTGILSGPLQTVRQTMVLDERALTRLAGRVADLMIAEEAKRAPK